MRLIKMVMLLFPFCLFYAETALADGRLKMESSLRTGGVRAELQIEEDERAARIQPGSIAPYLMTVRSEKGRAWVRVHVEVEGADALKGLLPLRFAGLSEHTVVKGDYIYCTRPLSEGEEQLLCEGFYIPDLSFLPEAVTFRIRAVPEALQDTGSRPDFGKKEPWDHMLELKDAPEFTERRADGSLLLQIDKDALHAQGSLFQGMGELFPGERVTEELIVENLKSASYGLRLRLMDTEALSETERKLLGQLVLKIEKNGKIVYQNHFLDDSLKRGISIGSFRRGKESCFFTVEVPKELENLFSETAQRLSWELSAQSYGGTGGSGSGGGGGARPNVRSERMYDAPDASLRTALTGGVWKLLDAASSKWSYTTKNGMTARNGWLYIHNPYADNGAGENAWFKFSADGIMEYGWIRSADQNWYYCHEKTDGRLGTMLTGWHTDAADGKRYYLDPVNGIMQTGWRTIDGRQHYFAAASDIPEQTWYYEAFDQALGDTAFGKWVYKRIGLRSYGSMYQNEKTPDGQLVDAEGAKREAHQEEKNS